MHYTVIAGVNGSGKSTLFNSGELDYSKSGVRVNVDELIYEKYDNNWQDMKIQIKAGREIVKKINRCIDNKLSFNQETTLSGKSVINTIRKTKDLGYTISLYYLGLDSPQLAVSRVKERVAKGGHGIPEDVINKRYFSSLKNLREILPICDNVYIYDNSVNKSNLLIVEDGIIKFKNMIPQYMKIYLSGFIKEIEDSVDMQDEKKLET